MKSTILCVTDFTSSSTYVATQACQMARQLRYHLTILYCYRLKIISSAAVSEIKKYREKEALDLFTVLESEIIKNFGIPYDFRAEVGFVTDRVEYHVRRENIRFLVLDKKMKVGHREIFDELLERISVPIVLITQNEFASDQRSDEMLEPVALEHR